MVKVRPILSASAEAEFCIARSPGYRVIINLLLKPDNRPGCRIEIKDNFEPVFNAYIIRDSFLTRIMKIVDKYIARGKYRKTDWVVDVPDKLKELDLTISKDVLSRACEDILDFLAKQGLELDNALLRIEAVEYLEYQITPVICEHLLKKNLGHLIVKSCNIDKEDIKHVIDTVDHMGSFVYSINSVDERRGEDFIEAWQQQIDERRKSLQEQVLSDRNDL